VQYGVPKIRNLSSQAAQVVSRTVAGEGLEPSTPTL
jgi:hypothetical protein